METNQPTDPEINPAPKPVAQAPALLTTKMPSAVAFSVAVLLFFLPFVDIKCNGASLQTVSGLQLATGFKMNNNSSSNSFLDDVKTDGIDRNITKATTQSDKRDPNKYAMIALGLGVLGLALSFTSAKAALGGAMVTGVAAAGAMIGLLIDIKKNVKTSIPGTNNSGGGSGSGLGDFGSSMRITVDFTSWFYIALIAFLAAAFFCYKRISANSTS